MCLQKEFLAKQANLLLGPGTPLVTVEEVNTELSPRSNSSSSKKAKAKDSVKKGQTGTVDLGMYVQQDLKTPGGPLDKVTTDDSTSEVEEVQASPKKTKGPKGSSSSSSSSSSRTRTSSSSSRTSSSSKSNADSPAKRRKTAATKPALTKEQKVAALGFDCSCVFPKSAAGCKENPQCNAKSKYVSLNRHVILPAWLVASAILSFFLEFEDVLVGGEKVETRRGWSLPYFNLHKKALDQNLFVRVWCGKKGRQIGYCVYRSIAQQQLGDMTQKNLVDEGRGDMSVDTFMTKYMSGCTSQTLVYVVRFTFIPFA